MLLSCTLSQALSFTTAVAFIMLLQKLTGMAKGITLCFSFLFAHEEEQLGVTNWWDRRVAALKGPLVWLEVTQAFDRLSRRETCEEGDSSRDTKPINRYFMKECVKNLFLHPSQSAQVCLCCTPKKHFNAYFLICT